MGGNCGSAAIVIAATGIADDETAISESQRIVTVMNVLAEAACVRARRYRERQRGEVSHECDE